MDHKSVIYIYLSYDNEYFNFLKIDAGFTAYAAGGGGCLLRNALLPT